MLVKIGLTHEVCLEKNSKNAYKVFSQLSSGDASDSICPKGWGMAGRDGDKSYQKLIVNIIGVNKAGIILSQIYKEYDIVVSPNDVATQRSLSFIRIGRNLWSVGIPNNRSFEGTSWGKWAIDVNGGLLNFQLGNIHPQNFLVKGYGFALRCVAKSLN